MLESEIQRQVLEYLKARNIFHFRAPNRPAKNRRYNLKGGVPDIIAVINGTFIGLEIKTETGVQSEDQKNFEKDLKKAGGKYYIIRSLKETHETLKGIV
jgi:hypothetical protein